MGAMCSFDINYILSVHRHTLCSECASWTVFLTWQLSNDKIEMNRSQFTYKMCGHRSESHLHPYGLPPMKMDVCSGFSATPIFNLYSLW